ncbi:nitroreductase family protein [Glycomyces sp. L485]|uniref:nitroreductase family protein n=1 Tax=Glycomyces sp. L485 TaxID=2909235 RepID=UPI001F4B975B|nr:nitroreductase family protein [Glycomyces sp. L485]MCH7233053.1 nitroreductase family protein [Glycomyces sp. L485]
MNGPTDRHAQTSVPIHPLLASRQSTRAFEAGVDLADEQVAALLEAARWAPSAGNTQPWRFILAKRETPDFKRVLDCLAPGNGEWAQHASALLVAVRVDSDAKGPLRHAEYDLGQSMAHLTFQAAAEGLTVRQMAGFDAEAIAGEFELPAELKPTSVVAIGVAGDPAGLAEAVAGPDSSPRRRLGLDELLIGV